jgi:predicted RNA binding protein YcfA (HicA-like mRNA interferase family)
MNARAVIAALKADGWYEVRRRGSHRHFRHPTKTGRVTVPDHGKDDLKIGTIKSIEAQSGVRLR